VQDQCRPGLERQYDGAMVRGLYARALQGLRYRHGQGLRQSLVCKSQGRGAGHDRKGRPAGLQKHSGRLPHYACRRSRHFSHFG
jgi:hypothetical protein